MKPNKMIVPVILAGGSGTRLWPSSRRLRPKPFIRLNFDGDTLFDKALQQIRHLNCEHLITVINEEHYFLSDELLKNHPDLKDKNQYILEPFGNNTAPAITLAALYIKENICEDAIMLVLSADHLINNTANFLQAIDHAADLAANNRLVTFGIEPTEPSTGFGYIQYDPSTLDVKAFKEKPDYQTAKSYIENGYLWNAGIFCFKAKVLLSELYETNNSLYGDLLDCYAKLSKYKNNAYKISAETFKEIENISIDYALFEKSNQISVIPCDLNWSDIGSWSSFCQLSAQDENQNSITPNTIHINTHNTFVRNMATKRLITTVGVKDLIIVDTPDALLVVDKNSDQDVKKLVDQVKKVAPEKIEHHQTVHRPWGAYTVLEEDPSYKIKRIVVRPGESLSLQMHHHRSEHWIVVSGVALVVNGDKEVLIHQNESTYIPAGQTHRLTNPGIIDCVLIEVQVGAYLGEDDIVRFTDVYGRS